MTVHRGRNRSGHRNRMDEERPLTLLETITAFTALQICICAVLLAAAFTLQYLDQEKYQLLGRYYLSVMGRAGEEEAVEVGNFGDPLEWEMILGELEKSVMGQVVEVPKGEAEETDLENQQTGGMGGENPYIPQNLYEGVVLVSAPARYPTYGTMTSPFGLREHPVTGNGDFHTGVDIAAPEGADIYAAYPGTVSQVGESEIYGNYITMDHGGGLTTTYCHCSLILAQEGQRLRVGARIAEVGSTGVVTGPHLHFEARVNGDYIDPLYLFAP